MAHTLTGLGWGAHSGQPTVDTAYLRIFFSPFITFHKHITAFHLSALIPKESISLHITWFLLKTLIRAGRNSSKKPYNRWRDESGFTRGMGGAVLVGASSESREQLLEL